MIFFFFFCEWDWKREEKWCFESKRQSERAWRQPRTHPLAVVSSDGPNLISSTYWSQFISTITLLMLPIDRQFALRNLERGNFSFISSFFIELILFSSSFFLFDFLFFIYCFIFFIYFISILLLLLFFLSRFLLSASLILFLFFFLFSFISFLFICLLFFYLRYFVVLLFLLLFIFLRFFFIYFLFYSLFTLFYSSSFSSFVPFSSVLLYIYFLLNVLI